MAAATPLPRCATRPFPRFRPRVGLSVRRSRVLVRAVAAAVGERHGTAVLWFKHDLRIDDHPGLVAAASRHRNVVPLYVFDRRILRGYPDEMLKVLVSALSELKTSLKDQGSDLFIGFGNVEAVIVKLVSEVKATHVFIEEEVEYDVRRVIGFVEESLLSSPVSWGSPEVVFWRTPFYDVKGLKDVPLSYKDFLMLRPLITEPVAAPKLASIKMELDTGTLPSYADLKKYLHEDACQSESWISQKSISAEEALRKGVNQTNLLVSGSDLGKSNGNPFYTGGSSTKKLKSTVFVSNEGTLVGGGTDVALNALAAYLRYLEGTYRDDWEELHDKLRLTESRRGASFGSLFWCVLHLGVLSRRRVHYETIKYEKERNAGFLSPFGYSATTVAAAIDAINSMEWYRILNLKCLQSDGRYPIRVWCWNGHLIQYTVVGNEGPPVLLVHGFGAFLDHYRDNICPLAEKGNRVWAITLLGFGKSEKPNVLYSELIWAECLRDFIIDVIGEPVHLVGNSIGGYFSASVAGFWPTLLKSLILINSAGPIIPGYSSAQLYERDRPPAIAWLGARLLLVYLQLTVRQFLRKCYPSNNNRANDWLVNEMLRASHDPGVHTVLECVFNFKLPVPLNYLLENFEGRILVIQGTKDPLSKSKSRLPLFRETCQGITIKELDAGHCPHDEKPDLVNSIITEWIMAVENKLHAPEGMKAPLQSTQ